MGGNREAGGGASAPERARRVLLAWEQGFGFGHTVRLRFIADALRREGIEVSAAVTDLELAAPLAEIGVPLVQAPRWPRPQPRPGDEVPASATLTDSLAAFGLRDGDSVRPVLAGWGEILDAARPDVVVCDYAPLATVAARGRARVMQLSTAYCLPPAHLETLPLLHSFAPPRHSDAEVVDVVSRSLIAQGLTPIERIGDLFAGDDVFVASWPVLDPYVELRRSPPEGRLEGSTAIDPRPDAEGIFAYLHPETVSRSDVLETLCTLGPRLEAHLPLLPAPLAARLEAAGVRLHRQRVPMEETLSRVRMIVHQGSAGVAADALLAGRPQFALGLHIEHYLNGEALTAAGVGRNARLFHPAVRLDAGQILAVLEDEDLALVADAVGRAHRAALLEPPLELWLKRCRALL